MTRRQIFSEKEDASKLVAGGLGAYGLSKAASSLEIGALKKVLQEDTNPEVLKKLSGKVKGIKFSPKTNNELAYYNHSTKSVHIDPKILKPSTLAHELGHAGHMTGQDGGKIGKLTHKIIQHDRSLSRTLSKGKLSGATTGIVSGFVSGINAGRKGEDEGAISKTAWVALPTLRGLPEVISESEASRLGRRYLKESGATKEMLKVAKKAHNKALLGRTAATIGVPIGISYGARQVGKMIGRKKQKKKDDQIKEAEL